MTEHDIETERMHWVFSWTGGEAHDEEWRDAKGNLVAQAEHWMEGAPDYAEEWTREEIEHSGTIRTVLACMDNRIEAFGWEQVARYSTSGECSCPCEVGVNEETDDNCPLCEGDRIIYIGDGWAEHVLQATGAHDDIDDVGPGKCEGAGRIGRALHALTENGADEETGDVQGPGYFLLLRSGVKLDGERIERWAREMDGDEVTMMLTPDEREELRNSAGAILTEDSDGFVSCELYSTTAELDEAWLKVSEHVDTFYADEDGAPD